jgi:Phage Terminase
METQSLSTKFAIYPPVIREQIAQRIEQRMKAKARAALELFGPAPAAPDARRDAWPAEYRNADTGRPYQPHHDDEARWIADNEHRYLLARGGEGGGKSVAGIVRDLNALRAGMNGVMVSPDFHHFRISLWPEFRRWCPVDAIIEKDRYRLHAAWEPRQPFELHFTTETGGMSTLYCGGIDDPTGWEGPNVGFAHIDEARRRNDPQALKVLDGRVRIPGQAGQKPQLWLTTTPRKHWLFDYFGPLVADDPLADFKADSFSIILLTSDNEAAGNLSVGFTRQRGQSLSESEKRVLLEAAWEDIDEVDRFLSSISLWDACKQELPDLDAHTPVILVMDAGESDDNFGTLMISRHPSNDSLLAVRYARAYVPEKGTPLDFDVIEQDIRDLCSRYAVQQIAYDPFLLGQMIRRLKTAKSDGTLSLPVECVPFPQGAARLEADKNLLDMITQRRIAHDGNRDLRKHLDNANSKRDSESRKLRIVKRMQSLKIDLAVCLSMGCARAFDVLFIEKRELQMA